MATSRHLRAREAHLDITVVKIPFSAQGSAPAPFVGVRAKVLGLAQKESISPKARPQVGNIDVNRCDLRHRLKFAKLRKGGRHH